MKIRMDFVTNSSSSSFVINKKDLSPEQLDLLTHMDKLLALIKQTYEVPCCYNFAHQWDDEYCSKCDYYICEADGWDIEEADNKIVGYTMMDNFDMIDFLKSIGVPLTDYDNSGSGFKGLVWLHENYKIDPFGLFAETEDYQQ